MYSEGSSVVKQDNTTAFDYFKKAADKVHSCLFYHLLSTYCLTDVCASVLVHVSVIPISKGTLAQIFLGGMFFVPFGHQAVRAFFY